MGGKEIYCLPLRAMEIKQREKEDYSFWTRYRRFAGNEILLYVVMVIGILLGIIIFS